MNESWISSYLDPYVTLALVILISVLLLGLYELFFHPLAKVPGPWIARFTTFWQIYHSYIGDEIFLIQELHRRYGKVVRIGPKLIDIADGAALGPIYVDKGGFMKTSNYHNFYIDGYPTIFSTSDPANRAPRAKAVAPLFSVAAIRRDSDRIRECVTRFVKRLHESKMNSGGCPVDLQEPARILGFEVMSSCLFRHQYPHKPDGANEKSVIPWLNAFVDIGPFVYFSNRWFKFCISTLERWRPQKHLEAKSAQAVHEFVLNLPLDHSNDSEKDDSMQRRLHQRGIAQGQIAAECKDFMFAGLHTFGAILATTLWYLAKDASAHDRLRDDIMKHQDTHYDIQQLPYLAGVVKEGLRLAPVNSGLPRVVPKGGWYFDGYHFPAGTVVRVSVPQLSSNPNVFSDPTAFQPDRWAEPTAEMQRDLAPFSLGIRQCIAKNLATMELFMAIKQVAESDVLRGAKPVADEIDVHGWFNTVIKGNRVDLVWPGS
ncbi:MAG: hypothetical protein Q9209_004850 [Squamulea sp. 1 TL-2023]